MTDNEIIYKKNKELSAILEVSKVLTASFDLEDNLNAAMSTLAAHLDMRRGCVFLVKQETMDINLVAAHGLTKLEISRGTYKIGEGVVGNVISSRNIMFIPDIGEEPLFLNKTGSRINRDGISFICIPLLFEGKALGVLTVDRIYAKEHGDLEDDLRVLKIISTLLVQFVKLCERYRNSEHEKESLLIQLKDRYSLPNIIGNSEMIQSVLKSVRKVAASKATVLLLGESGTGKELIANTIHFQSDRAKGPFVAVNCAALPDNLLEVELFGAEKGAFTGAGARRIGRFELAEEGSIFLDEIGEMPISLQAKLLRVLQEGTFERLGSSIPIRTNVRVIAATNKNLYEEVKAGRFRDDLFWRLNVLPILLPSLRQRKGDVPVLVNFHLDKFNRMYKKTVSLDEEAMAKLEAYEWPGNVRELSNTIERLVLMTDKEALGPEDITFGQAGQACSQEESVAMAARTDNGTLKSEVVNIERHRIMNALMGNNYIQNQAARALGITPRQIGYKIKKYNIQIPETK